MKLNKWQTCLFRSKYANLSNTRSRTWGTCDVLIPCRSCHLLICSFVGLQPATFVNSINMVSIATISVSQFIGTVHLACLVSDRRSDHFGYPWIFLSNHMEYCCCPGNIHNVPEHALYCCFICPFERLNPESVAICAADRNRLNLIGFFSFRWPSHRTPTALGQGIAHCGSDVRWPAIWWAAAWDNRFRKLIGFAQFTQSNFGSKNEPNLDIGHIHNTSSLVLSTWMVL